MILNKAFNTLEINKLQRYSFFYYNFFLKKYVKMCDCIKNFCIFGRSIKKQNEY